MRNHAKKIEELKLPKERCVRVSPKRAWALKELREGLEKLKYEEIVKALEG